jgi:hypothetical protein
VRNNAATGLGAAAPFRLGGLAAATLAVVVAGAPIEVARLALSETLPLGAFPSSAIWLVLIAQEAGLAERLGAHFARAPGGRRPLLYVLVCACALLTATVSLDGAVVLMVPLVIALARRARDLVPSQIPSASSAARADPCSCLSRQPLPDHRRLSAVDLPRIGHEIGDESERHLLDQFRMGHERRRGRPLRHGLEMDRGYVVIAVRQVC